MNHNEKTLKCLGATIFECLNINVEHLFEESVEERNRNLCILIRNTCYGYGWKCRYDEFKVTDIQSGR